MSTQRALELADLLVAESCKSMSLDEDATDEIAAILRHYAEIMQAEAVRWLYQIDGVPHDTVVRNKLPASDGMTVHGLIIKPKPLERK